MQVVEEKLSRVKLVQKLIVKKKDIVDEAKKLFGKVLVTPQTGPDGRVVKRIYIQKALRYKKRIILIMSCR